MQDRDSVTGHRDRVERLVLQDGVENFVLVVTAERRLPEEHLVHEDAERPPVDCATVPLLEQDLGRIIVSTQKTGRSPVFWAYLGRHELGRTTERARSGPEPHLLFAQTVISDLDVPLHREENVIKLQVAERLSVNAAVGKKFNLGLTGR